MIIQKKRIEDNSKQGINLINEGTRIDGHVEAIGDVRMDGQLNGNISTAGRLAIGASGKVTGQIKCEQADVAGVVHGPMQVTHTLTLRQTAEVLGNIRVGKLVIEDGARFNGQCKMTGLQVMVTNTSETDGEAL
jgi:cytoskeletal protein CcmA (bactofilin family)